ncbi:hypothetical protein AORI_4527 [Amycolatopsis keratiniphila]|uniref:Uncharacterized protein n=1 Tax=Amycolatopsis keratiniphila TaxID=129921 RepID=R4T3W5_9PSEU|nr:hypothetical protein AORI_4527 [Amycolatopsis keratiniphila]
MLTCGGRDSLDVISGLLRTEVGGGCSHEPERVEPPAAVGQLDDACSQRIVTFDPADLLEVLRDPLALLEISGCVQSMETAVHRVDKERSVAHHCVRDLTGAQVALALAMHHPAKPVRADFYDHHVWSVHRPPGHMPLYDLDSPFLGHHDTRLEDTARG